MNEPLIKPNKEEAELHGIIPGPVFQDHCDHLNDPNDNYLCSFELVTTAKGKFVVQQYDLYLIKEPHYNGRHTLCIRYGNEGSEYISPGPVNQFLVSAAVHRAEPYLSAARILTDFGYFTWQINPPKT